MIRTLKGPSYSGSGEEGQVAVISILLLLMFAAYGIVSFVNIADESSSVAYGLRAREAIYAAETGLEYALVEIRAGVPNAGNISGLMVGGTTVNVTNSGNTLLTSVATTQDPALTRSISLSINVVQIPREFAYALYVKDETTLTLNEKADIDGRILFDGLSLTLGSKLSLINNYTYVPQTATITNSTGDWITRVDYPTQGSPPDAFPVIVTDYYDDYVNNVLGYESVGDTITDPTEFKKVVLSDYTDNVLYRVGNLKLKDQITGPGIICATGNIELNNKKKKNVGPDVQIIAGGDIKLKKMNVYSGTPKGSILFSHGNITLESEAKVEGSVVSMGNLEIKKKKVTIDGACIVYGSVTLGDDYVINGSLMTSQMSNFTKGSILFTADNLTDLSIPGLQSQGTSIEVDKLSWREN